MIFTSACITTFRVCADAIAGTRAMLAASAVLAAHFKTRIFRLLFYPFVRRPFFMA